MTSKFFRQLPFLFVATIALASCGSSSQTTTTTRPVATVDTSSASRDQFLDWLSNSAGRARSLSVTGDITLDQGGSSNSASFSMKNKRLREPTADEADPTHRVMIRVDSLSVEVIGPLGIKVARFMASPERYQYYDILEGQNLSGPTDSKSLEALTRLNGISLGMMSDLIYGLVPDGSRISETDSMTVFAIANRRTMVLYRTGRNTTEVIDLDVVPDQSVITPMRLRYRRWNGFVADPLHSSVHSVVWIDFSKYSMINDVAVPGHIQAVAGDNKLSLDYSDVKVNPSDLTVRIKMP